ncbi:glycosyltransferase [Erysipelotrichaceae bacterium OttesenSCG-928-M19]|nr:glycosyltransferase [Erysipelotrichaceae bacterium OttesenSCG-928-M19]
MNVSIVVPYTNTYELMVNFLEKTIPLVNKYGYELVLVKDEDCSAEMNEVVAKLIAGNQLIKHIDNGYKNGCSVANNIGVANASNEIIAFVNNDVFLQDDTIEILKAELLSDDKIGVVQPLLLYPNSNLVQSTGHTFGEYHNSHTLINRDYNAKIVQTRAVRQGLTSATYVMRKSLFNELGGFDTMFYNAWEGLDFTIRVTASGKQCIYLPKAVAYHIQGGSRERIFRNQNYQDSYFWLKNKKDLQCDFQSIIMEQLNDLEIFNVNNEYHFINCSSYSYEQWQPLLALFKGQITKESITLYNSDKAIKLEDKVILSELKKHDKVIYLVDNYTKIKNNKYVFKEKDSKNDIVIDISGNVLAVASF